MDTGAPKPRLSKTSAPPAKKTKTAGTSTTSLSSPPQKTTKKPAPVREQEVAREPALKKKLETTSKKEALKPQVAGSPAFKVKDGAEERSRSGLKVREDKRKGAMNEFVQTNLDKGVADSGQEANVSGQWVLEVANAGSNVQVCTWYFIRRKKWLDNFITVAVHQAQYAMKYRAGIAAPSEQRPKASVRVPAPVQVDECCPLLSLLAADQVIKSFYRTHFQKSL